MERLIGVNVQVKTFHCLRMVEVLQVLGVKPLLKGKVSEQLDVGLCNFLPVLLFLRHLFQTTQYTQTQFLQCLYICMTQEQHIKKNPQSDTYQQFSIILKTDLNTH